MRHFIYFIICAALILKTAFAEEEMTPPPYEVIDEHGVNLFTGQPSTTVPTTAIGGGIGLSHHISTVSAEVIAKRYGITGYIDKFNGIAKRELYIRHEGVKDIYTMNVNDPDGSHQFSFYQDGNQVTGEINSSNGYSFRDISDTGHSLVVSGPLNNYVDWIKPNGAISRFHRGENATSFNTGWLHEMIYPNGLRIRVHRTTNGSTIQSVTTNTGYQLKYNYAIDDRPLASNKLQATNDPDILANSGGWSSKNPDKIIALNAAVEFCNPLANPRNSSSPLPCSFANKWPTAQFFWPGGMPRAFHIGRSESKIIDMYGEESIYTVEAFNQDANGAPVSPARHIPRLISFKPAKSNLPLATYEYKQQIIQENIAIPFGNLYLGWVFNPWVLSKASGRNGELQYQINWAAWLASGAWGQNPQTSQLFQSITDRALIKNYSSISWSENGKSYSKSSKVESWAWFPGRLRHILSGEYQYKFEESYRNNVKYKYHAFDIDSNPIEEYTYGSRGNLTTKIMHPAKNSTIASTPLTYTASYLPSCSESTRRYCNKPEWTMDATGNKTYFTYHPESGQVASKTLPSDSNGIVAQTRFEYKLHYANYFHGDGVKRQATDGIWLLSKESYCASSNYNNGSCERAKDEVVTDYEYFHDNLHMTAMIVTAQDHAGNLISKRTCYEYDIYGNRTAETVPSGTGAICPRQ